MRTHLITGGTGFIGAALVIELLQRTDDAIVAIVRPGDSSPERRFHAAVTGAAEAYGLGSAVAAKLERCRVVAGDVLEERCGVREEISARHVQFWHCAASLRFEDRHQEEIQTTNVEGTRHALALARSLEVEAFNHISTAYVAGTSSGVIREELAGAVSTNNHYERSKVMAEHLVGAANGFRKRILRPSIVVGHSLTRAATAFSGFYGFLRQLVQFRGMMERMQAGLAGRTPLRMRVDPHSGLDLVPVDMVAEEAVRIGLSGEADGVFHLTHPSPPAVGLVICTLFRSAGLHEPAFVPTRDGFEWLDGRFDKRLDFYGSYLIGEKRFDRSRSDAVLGGRRGPEVRFEGAELESFAHWYLARLERERAGLPVAR
jgi:nucleoside-diphosphate-sugar epimerase